LALNIASLLIIDGLLVVLEVEVVMDTTGSFIVGWLIVGLGVWMDAGEDVGIFIIGAVVHNKHQCGDP
jgi:hypothetical protein